MASSTEEPWHKVFPEPTETAPSFKKENLLRLYQTIGDVLNAGMLLIDLRRMDYEGGTIRGSLNIPAQSFYMNMSPLYRLCQGDGVNVITRVLFYCGSSGGRAPRCAAWFKDYLNRRAADDEVESHSQPAVFVLEEGIKGWAAGGPTYTQYMDFYNPTHWKQFEQDKDSGKRPIDTSGAGTEGAAMDTETDSGSPTKKQRGEEPEATG